MRLLLFQFLIVGFFFSCTTKKNKVGTDAVYAEYGITGDESAENVTCELKFFEGRRSSRAVLLEPPAAVLFDGIALTPDSAGRNGALYQVQKPLAQFSGTHTIVFKNAAGKEYKESFSFQPFSLDSDIEETVPRSDLVLQINGLQATDYLRVVLTDTSFATPDINDIDTVKNGTLVITDKALRNVANGPVTLHLYKEEERPLKQAPGSGGMLSITYGLSREFELTGE